MVFLNLDEAQKLTQSAAVIIGGLWAYFKFFKGRTFRPRVETTVSAVIKIQNQVPYLAITAAVKNIGLTTFIFATEAKCIEIFGATVKPAPEVQAALPQEFDPVRVFKDHRWLEPGETAHDLIFLELPASESTVYSVKLRFLSHGRHWTRKSEFPWLRRKRISWSRVAIVTNELPESQPNVIKPLQV